MPLAPRVPRVKALEPTGFSKIVFMLITDCKWNKIPPTPSLSWAKAVERRTGFMPGEMPPHVEPVPS